MKNPEQTYFTYFTLDNISFQAFASTTGISQLILNKEESHPNGSIKLHSDDPYFFDLKKQLAEYLSRQRKSFSIPLDLHGTEFQRKVWNELIKIPYGHTISYKTLAEKMGGETYTRAVGKANATNPVPIIVPCHRVINSNGKLGGYSCGIKIKERLLELEGSLSLELFD